MHGSPERDLIKGLANTRSNFTGNIRMGVGKNIYRVREEMNERGSECTGACEYISVLVCRSPFDDFIIIIIIIIIIIAQSYQRSERACIREQPRVGEVED